MTIKRFARVGALAVISAIALSACSTGGPGTPEESDACTPSDGPVTLEYWTWGAGYEAAADLWNEKNPDIQVQFSEIPVGISGGYQKMSNAVQAGEAPDVAFVEFDAVPAFRSEGSIINIADCLAAGATDDFIPAIWDQFTLGESDAAYGLPIGGGPMALYYRTDLLEQYGIDVPTTWDEFADAARAVNAADPDVYLANFPLNAPNWFTGLVAQTGTQWFTNDGSAWSVELDGADSQQVAAYWQELIDEGVVSTINDFSPEWNSAVAESRLLTWPSAVWGAGIVKAAAPDQSGLWGVAQLPNWGSPVSAAWGGGGLAVMSGTEHPYEASQFALWMATDPEALAILNAAIGIYPTTNALLADPIFDSEDEFFGGQNVFNEFKTATENLPSFAWGPDMAATYTAISDSLAVANQEGSRDFVGALTAAQAQLLAALEQKGVPLQ